MTPFQEKYIRSLLDKAEHDLVTAQRVLEIEPMILDTACFHCQQAVEKCLRAYLAWKEQELEKNAQYFVLVI